jgi:rRNA-processing protein FCF1
MKKIILDTSIILTALKFKVDLISELERICNFNYSLYIIDKTFNELKNKPNEKLALAFIDHLIKIKKLKILKITSKKHTDDILVSLSNKAIIATQDQELKRRVKEKGAQIITIRQKSHLIME